MGCCGDCLREKKVIHDVDTDLGSFPSPPSSIITAANQVNFLSSSSSGEDASSTVVATQPRHSAVEKLRDNGGGDNWFSSSSEEYSVEDMEYYMQYEPTGWPVEPSSMRPADRRRLKYEDQIRASRALAERKKLIDEYESLKEEHYAVEYQKEASQAVYAARLGGDDVAAVRRNYWQAIRLKHTQKAKDALKREYNTVYRELTK